MLDISSSDKIKLEAFPHIGINKQNEIFTLDVFRYRVPEGENPGRAFPSIKKMR